MSINVLSINFGNIKKGYFAVTGKWKDYPAFEDILNGERNVKISNGSTCMYSQGKQVYIMIQSPRRGLFYEMKTTVPWSEGAGSDQAMVAMSLGKSAIEAVKIAAKHTLSTGGRVRWVKVR